MNEDEKLEQVGFHNVSGKWSNDHGSTMQLEVTNDLRLQGDYSTTVQIDQCSCKSPLIGLLNQKNGAGVTLTFSVAWDAGSCTTWVGQYFKADSKEVLKTMWLRRSAEAGMSDNWKGTRWCLGYSFTPDGFMVWGGCWYLLSSTIANHSLLGRMGEDTFYKVLETAE